jgi:hypothetical protein
MEKSWTWWRFPLPAQVPAFPVLTFFNSCRGLRKRLFVCWIMFPFTRVAPWGHTGEREGLSCLKSAKKKKTGFPWKTPVRGSISLRCHRKSESPVWSPQAVRQAVRLGGMKFMWWEKLLLEYEICCHVKTGVLLCFICSLQAILHRLQTFQFSLARHVLLLFTQIECSLGV